MKTTRTKRVKKGVTRDDRERVWEVLTPLTFEPESRPPTGRVAPSKENVGRPLLLPKDSRIPRPSLPLSGTFPSRTPYVPHPTRPRTSGLMDLLLGDRSGGGGRGGQGGGRSLHPNTGPCGPSTTRGKGNLGCP